MPCTFYFLQQGKKDRLPGDLLRFQSSRPHEGWRGEPGFCGSRRSSSVQTFLILQKSLTRGRVWKEFIWRHRLEESLSLQWALSGLYRWHQCSSPHDFFHLPSAFFSPPSPLLVAFCSGFEGFISFFTVVLSPHFALITQNCCFLRQFLFQRTSYDKHT